ncbi:cation-transporting P-type ATPase [Corynebacterium amycolatum]|nr:cation-transporting P-type ATPase [Corynebacterium amycolatum]
MAKQIIRREFGLDILAVIAMVATLAVGEYIAASIIALMLTGGEALENYAAYCAKRDLRSLLDRAPHKACRLPSLDAAPDDAEEILIEDVAKGDYLLVRPSEVVPVDGVTFDKTSVDESSLTGEAGLFIRTSGIRFCLVPSMERRQFAFKPPSQRQILSTRRSSRWSDRQKTNRRQLCVWQTATRCRLQ